MRQFAERLVRELELEPGRAAALAASFLRATREDLVKLQAAALAANAPRVASLAHHVQGAAASLEVEAIRSRAAALERAARAGELGCAADLLSGIESELELLEAGP